VRPGRKPRWARQVKSSTSTTSFSNLGAGTAPATLDLFLSADIGITVSSPEPPSIEATYRFMRAVFKRVMRRLLSKDRFKMRLLERAEADLGPLPGAPRFGARAFRATTRTWARRRRPN